MDEERMISDQRIPHRITVFAGNCRLCKDAVQAVEVGKCKECDLEVLDINLPENAQKIKMYDIVAVPTIIIDDKIKVVGVPQFAWFCGDEFYNMLEKKYPLTYDLK
ncbi:MAG: thioredoxin family protein [archaeon]|nr:thioredoxin family protein [archaeon]